MKDKKIDWTSFRKRITIGKPLPAVYAAWAVPIQLENWFLEKAVYVDRDGAPRESDKLVQKGDRFIWKWHNHASEENGEIIDENGKDMLSFTFGAGGKVRVELSEQDGVTEVQLTQYGIPADDNSKMDLYVECSTGWTFWLTNLKVWLEQNNTLHARGLSEEEAKDRVNG